MPYDEPCKIMEGFLEPEKCAYLIDTYQGLCKRSTVVNDDGKDILDTGRTSSTYFMPDTDPVVSELRRKAAQIAGVPETHIEGLQLVRYAKGEQYKFHHDYFDAIKDNQREHTFLVYLNEFDITEGGATIFKHYGVKVYPRTGRCIWFRDMIDGKLNEKSLHSGEEVMCDKVKYAVNIWIREKPLTSAAPTPPTPTPLLSPLSPFFYILFAILGIALLAVVYHYKLYPRMFAPRFFKPLSRIF